MIALPYQQVPNDSATTAEGNDAGNDARIVARDRANGTVTVQIKLGLFTNLNDRIRRVGLQGEEVVIETYGCELQRPGVITGPRVTAARAEAAIINPVTLQVSMLGERADTVTVRHLRLTV